MTNMFKSVTAPKQLPLHLCNKDYQRMIAKFDYATMSTNDMIDIQIAMLDECPDDAPVMNESTITFDLLNGRSLITTNSAKITLAYAMRLSVAPMAIHLGKIIQ